eukprot:superscaffoldBa00000972_g8275
MRTAKTPQKRTWRAKQIFQDKETKLIGGGRVWGGHCLLIISPGRFSLTIRYPASEDTVRSEDGPAVVIR